MFSASPPQNAHVIALDATARACATEMPSSFAFDVYDMDCAACALLIENDLRKLSGVITARVHFATQRAHVAFDARHIGEDAIAARVASLGHTIGSSAHDRKSVARSIRRRFQWQTGLAALCAMQIMMFSVPRFLGGDDIEPELGRLMDGSALLLTLPVLMFCADSFVRGARREWCLRRLGMDSAIAISLTLAFAGSLWHLWVASGALYFDSIAMFVALLLGVRWFEWEKREQNRDWLEQSILPLTTKTYALFNIGEKQFSNYIEINNIAANISIIIGRYDAVPVDGVLIDANAELDESILTGESRPVRRSHNENVCAGAINLGEPFAMRATASTKQSTTHRLLDLADQSDRPDHRSLTEWVSRFFVPTMFCVAALTFVAFASQGLTLALERAIAVLIVSCPCALALAAPAARARAFAQLAREGIVVRRSDALDRLAYTNVFVFDKTGTLTDPSSVRMVSVRSGFSGDRARAIVASLERFANHPLANSIRNAFSNADALDVVRAKWHPGLGVEGEVDGIFYRLGKPDFALEIETQPRENRTLSNAFSYDTALLLTDRNGIVCAIEYTETLRNGARELIAALGAYSQVELLSGDRRERVERVATQLHIEHARSGVTATEKSDRIEALQREGSVVAMIGDGWNDSVAFAKADVSIAANRAVDAALRGADIICAANTLGAVHLAIDYAKRLRRIVRENYMWAIAYNALAVPVAAFGFVDPIVAAIGMGASSVLVVLNTMRLNTR
jgi:P-type Cu2+ transporter